LWQKQLPALIWYESVSFPPWNVAVIQVFFDSFQDMESSQITLVKFAFNIFPIFAR
jgi:hypothetical protein